MKLRRLLASAACAALLASSALAQTQSGVGPTPNANTPPAYAPLAGCVYMPAGVALAGYVGPMGLTCGPNGGLNVNVLSGGGGGSTSGSVYGLTAPSVAPTGNGLNPFLNGFIDANGKVATVSPTTGLPVTTLPTSTTGSTSGVMVGTTSAQAAAAQSRKFLALDNESATATLSCAFGGTAAINTAGSFTIPPQNTRTWSGTYVPADAVNCVASAASTPLTLEQN